MLCSGCLAVHGDGGDELVLSDGIIVVNLVGSEVDSSKTALGLQNKQGMIFCLEGWKNKKGFTVDRRR